MGHASPDDGETIVITGTRTPEDADASPVQTDVVTREDAERRGATNAAEALATQPGVQVNPGAYGYLGGISAIQIQGFDRNRVLILEDGEPIIGDVGGAIDLANIPLADLDRIEIVAGPTSALYGSSALGGVVSFLSAPPPLDGWSGRVRVEGRSHRGLLVDGGGAARAHGWWAALDLAYSRMAGIAEDAELPDFQIPAVARSLVGLRAGHVSARVDWQVRVRWLHQAIDGLESTAYPGIGRFLTDLPDRTSRIAAQEIATVKLGAASVRFASAYQAARDDDGTIPRGSDGETQRSRETATSFEATATIPDGARTWVAGARAEGQHLSQDLDQGATTETEVAPTWLWALAAYGQLEWKLGRFTVLPGVRVEDHGSYGAIAAPRLAIAARFGEWSVRAGAGRGYRVPSAEELGFNFDHSIYGYKVIGDPDLQPERSWGVNGDVAVRPWRGLVVRAGGFANWVRDLIDIDLAAGTTMGSVVTYAYANFERVRTAGGQASATLRITDTVDASIAYDYLWTRDDVAHAPLAGEPAHTLTASVHGQLPLAFEGTARVRVTGRAYVDDTTRSPGYSTIDLRLSRPVWRSLDAEVGVTNLLDVHQTPGAVGDLRPPLGRVIYAGVRAAF